MDVLIIGLQTLCSPYVLSMLLIGIVAGLIIGTIPGLNDNIAFAVFLPFSFSMRPDAAMALMVGVYCSTAIGGAIPAIMIRVPGTASSMLTLIDGNAMARKGQAGQAMSIAVSSSVIGGTFSAVVLLFFAPMLARFAIRFTYPENFALGVLGLSSVVGMLSGNLVKGLVSAALGLLLATVGYTLETGQPRYVFDNPNLIEGLPFVSLLIGLFGVAAVFELLEEIFAARRQEARGEKAAEHAIPEIGSLKLDKPLIRRLIPTWIRSSLIGTSVGIAPGAGALMAIYIAYDQAARAYRRRRDAKSGDVEWGEGVPEGVAAPEAANNGVVSGSMVPLLALGIPGNSVSALFIAALAIQGMVPGPLLFTEHLDIAWMILVAFVIANLVMGPLSYLLINTMTRMVFSLPKETLAAAVAFLCLTGAYADGNNIFNVWVALIAGIAGFVMKKLKVPLAPAILGLVLGRKIEDSLSNALTVSDGNWAIFIDPVNHPISLVLMLASAAFLVGPLLSAWRKHRRVSVSVN